MNAARIHSAINRAHLLVPGFAGHNARSHRHNAIAGFGDPRHEAQKSRATIAAFLCRKYGSPYNGRAVWETVMSAGPHAGSPTCTVPLTRLATGKRSYRPQHEDSIMAIKATSTGEICPAEIHFIFRSTLEKRVRRALASKGYRLLKSRAGTAAFREYGQYAVENGIRRIIAINHDLSLLAHELGVLADNERLQPKYNKIAVATYRYEDQGADRIEHFVIGQPGTGKMPFDVLAGPFVELEDAAEARVLMQGGRGYV